MILRLCLCVFVRQRLQSQHIKYHTPRSILINKDIWSVRMGYNRTRAYTDRRPCSAVTAGSVAVLLVSTAIT